MNTVVFHSPRWRILQAQTCLADIERKTVEFFQSEPYEHIIEDNLDGIHKDLKIRIMHPVPFDISGTVAVALEHLRSALDQAGNLSAIAAGRVGAKKTNFPFGDTKSYVMKMNAGACKDLPPEIFSLFCSFKPYKGGDNLLFALNKLCNTSKHWSINPSATGCLGEERNFTVTKGSVIGHPVPILNSSKNEIVLATATLTSEFKYDLDLTFYIHFSKTDVVDGYPVDSVISTLIGKVAGIVDATESECRRLGWLK